MDKIKIKDTYEFRKGKFIVHYTLTCSCGCKTTRHSYVWTRKTKPTDEQSLKKITDELKNK